MAQDDRETVPVVGIGASAGGIEAVGTVLDHMPADTGLAIVVIMHLDPSRESHLSDVFARHTDMRVVDAEDGMPVLPNRVHVLPPNAKLRLADGRLRLEALDQPRAERRPIDDFFMSLAADCGDRAICMILSGSGSNGSAGLKQVKAAGGLAIVQAPDTAQFGSMPRNAIATGVADLILPPQRIPEALIHYVRHPHAMRPVEDIPEDRAATLEKDLNTILALLRARTRQEFRCYKRKTLLRRIYRRVGLRQVDGLGRYAALLREEPDEVKTLARDLLINVTSFFRDQEAWQALAETAIDPLIAEHQSDAPLRLWVPGCATGEEAYSLAMLFSERAEAAQTPIDLKIFATDVSADVLEIGRNGVYPASAVEELAPDRVARFFEREDDTFRVRKGLRDTVIFARQNLLQDPPFSRLDLISCRNLLIYVEPEFQRKIISLFHFALRQDGYLFLGNAETAAGYDDLFETLSKKCRIYRRMGPTRHDIIDFPIVGHDRGEHAAQHQVGQPAPEPSAAKGRTVDVAKRTLLERYAPPSVLVDRRLKVLHFFGATGKFLRQPTGDPTTDLIALLCDGLQHKVSAAAHEALTSRTPAATATSIKDDGGLRPVEVTLTPLRTASNPDTVLLISFAEPADRERPAAEPVPARQDGVTEHHLEEELRATREELRITVEQMEGANEELKASNEEIMSMNEELQSANEELETSKEELQSLNEELNTVNSQLQNKVNELEGRTNDLNNLLNSTDIATLFLDTGLRIRWFTPAIKDLLDLMPSDVGRPLSHFAHKFIDSSFADEAAGVLRSLVPRSNEVPSDDGRWYIRRILPYRTEDNRIDGVVVTFTDVTGRKKGEEDLAKAKAFAESIVDTLHQPLLVLDKDLRVVSANTTFYNQFQVIPSDTEGRFVYDLGNSQWDIPQLHRLLGEILPQQKVIKDFEVEHEFESLGRRVMLLNARQLDHVPQILIAIDDVTERKRAEEQVRKSEERLRRVLETDAVGVIFFDEAGTVVDANNVFFRMTGYSRAEVEARDLTWRLMTPPEWIEVSEAEMDGLAATGHIGPYEKEYLRKDGSPFWMLFAGRSLGDGTIVEYCIDVTDRKRTEAALRKSEERLHLAQEVAGVGTFEWDIQANVNRWSPELERLYGLPEGGFGGTCEDWRALVHPDDLPEAERRVQISLETGRLSAEWRVVRPDGDVVWVLARGIVEKDARGVPLRMIGVNVDITARVEAEEHQKLLMAELDHRVKNVLAAVQSMAQLSLRDADPDAANRFNGRLAAFAQSHALLAESRWKGASLRRLVGAAGSPYRGDDGISRVSVDGSEVEVAAKAAQTLTLVFHELMTNAAKHGALSTVDGRLDIVWEFSGSGDNRRLILVWRETGGPPVERPPQRKGFGSRLIERTVSYELGGKVEMDYRPSGLVATIELPMAVLTAAP